MTVDQAVKKFKLEPLNVYTAKAKAKELNVDEVLYMNVQKNKYAYVVKDDIEYSALRTLPLWSSPPASASTILSRISLSSADTATPQHFLICCIF